jgi:hypothetical protein
MDVKRTGGTWFPVLLVLSYLLAGCYSDGDSQLQPPGLQSFALAGEVRGLESQSIDLELNDGEETLSLSEDGPFDFQAAVPALAGFSVQVARQPDDPGLHCTVSGGQGVVRSSDIDDILVSCVGPAPQALSLERAVQLAWNHADEVDIFYSTDRHCDWDNYSVCADGGMVSAVTGGSYTLTVDEHGLRLDVPHYFVVVADGRHSATVGGRPWRPDLDGLVNALAVEERLGFLAKPINLSTNTLSDMNLISCCHPSLNLDLLMLSITSSSKYSKLGRELS